MFSTHKLNNCSGSPVNTYRGRIRFHAEVKQQHTREHKTNSFVERLIKQGDG